MANILSQASALLHGLEAIANAFAGTVYSAPWKMNLYQRATAIIHKGVGATGTSTITVQCCSDTSHTGATAIPFRYRKNTDTTAGSAMGALTAATAAGFTTTAGSHQLYEIEIDAKDIPDGLPYVEVKCVEVVASPVLGGIIVVVHEPKMAGATMPAIT